MKYAWKDQISWNSTGVKWKVFPQLDKRSTGGCYAEHYPAPSTQICSSTRAKQWAPPTSHSHRDRTTYCNPARQPQPTAAVRHSSGLAGWQRRQRTCHQPHPSRRAAASASQSQYTHGGTRVPCTPCPSIILSAQRSRCDETRAWPWRKAHPHMPMCYCPAPCSLPRHATATPRRAAG